MSSLHTYLLLILYSHNLELLDTVFSSMWPASLLSSSDDGGFEIS